MSVAVPIICFIALLVGAYFYDEWKWRSRSRDELVGMVLGADWRLHPKALSELRRRGEDLQFFLPCFLPVLADDSKKMRVFAESIIRKFYPHIAAELKSYSSVANAEACRKALRPILARYLVQADGLSGAASDAPN